MYNLMSEKTSKKTTSKKKEREKITIVLDLDILEFFRTRAEQPDYPKYQAQINNELRRVMEATKESNKSGLSPIESSILENKIFIKILKEKMEKI